MVEFPLVADDVGAKSAPSYCGVPEAPSGGNRHTKTPAYGGFQESG